MKAFAYLRVSSKDQVKGTSLDKQREICGIIARSLGIPDPDIYEEPGLSGESIKGRPVFQSLLGRVARGDYDNGIGVAFDQDRLSRSTADWTQIAGILKQHRIRLHTSQGVMDFSKRDQRLTANIKGSLSEWHLDYIREQTVDGKRRKMLEGAWPGGPRLWGYRYDPARPKGERLQIDPETAPSVRMLLIELDQLPLNEMAREMNRRGIPSPLGSPWNSNKVSSFFDKNRLLRYSGYARVYYRQNGDGEWRRIPEGILVKGQWPALISPTERDRLLRKREQMRRSRVYPTRANKLLTGLGIAVCGYCGASVATTSCHRNRDGTVRAYYGCTNRSCSHRPHLRLEVLDRLVVGMVRHIDPGRVAAGYDYLVSLRSKQDPAGRIAEIEARVRRLVAQRSALVEKIGSGLIRDDEARPVLKKLRDELAEIEGRKEQLTAESKQAMLSPAEFQRLRVAIRRFDRLSPDRQRLGLKALVARLTLWCDRCELQLTVPIGRHGETSLSCPVSSTGEST